MKPTLITLEGDSDFYRLSGEEIKYLRNNYPELLGVWATIIKGLTAIGKGIFKGVKKRVRRKRAARRQKYVDEYKNKVRRVNQMAKIQTVLYWKRVADANKKKKTKILLLMTALPIAALFLLGS